MRKQEIAKIIDHTVLGPTCSSTDVKKLCEEAEEYKFASVCVSPCYANIALQLLKDSEIKVCVVVGFPHGMNAQQVKAFEAQHAIADGVDELDMVINLGALKSGDYEAVLADIKAVCAEADKAPTDVLVKVILETALLEREEKIAGAILSKAGGADFVKTSTGFGPGGATVDDVRLLRETVGNHIGVKAAGGIHDYETAIAMVEAGASRIGASRSIAIVEGAPQ